MSLAVVMHAYSLRYVVPTTIMLGSSPTFISLWAAIKVLTICLPQRFYTALDDRLYSAYQKLVLFFFNTVTGVKIKAYGDTSRLYGEKENVIVLFNHQCTVDWVVANMLASAQGSIGSIRYILKDGLRFFPLYGFYFRQHSCVYVKRDKKFSQEKTEREFAAFKTSNIPGDLAGTNENTFQDTKKIRLNMPRVWMVIFPEGTRMNPDLPQVINRSKQFAQDQGLEELNHVLMPKLKGFQLSVEQLRDHVTAIYDVTIAYSNTIDKDTGDRTPAPGMLEFLNGASSEIHLHFERIPISDVPNEESKLKMWLYNRFQFKDKLLEHFYSKNKDLCGKFPGQSDILHISRRQTLPAFLFFGSCLTVLLATDKGRLFYSRVGLCGSLAGILYMSIRS